eukprot:1356483-Rhodomonas_salina.1
MCIRDRDRGLELLKKATELRPDYVEVAPYGIVLRTPHYQFPISVLGLISVHNFVPAGCRAWY